MGGNGNRKQLAVRLQRAEVALREAQRGLDGSEGARMRYLAARAEHATAERDAVEALLSDAATAAASPLLSHGEVCI